MEPRRGTIISDRASQPTSQPASQLSTYFDTSAISMLCGVPTTIVSPINKVYAVSPPPSVRFLIHPNCSPHQGNMCGVLPSQYVFFCAVPPMEFCAFAAMFGKFHLISLVCSIAQLVSPSMACGSPS